MQCKKIKILLIMFVFFSAISMVFAQSNSKNSDVNKVNINSSNNIKYQLSLKGKIEAEVNKIKLKNIQDINDIKHLANNISNDFEKNKVFYKNELEKINLKIKLAEDRNKDSINYVTSAYKNVDWWLAAISIFLIIFSITVPLLMTINLREKSERKLEKIEQLANESEINLEKIKAYVKVAEKDINDIRSNKDEFTKIVRGTESQSAGEVRTYSTEENEIIAKFAEDESVPAKDRLTALGLKAYQSKDWDKALSYFSLLLDIEPTNPMVLFNLGYINISLAKTSTDKDIQIKYYLEGKELFLQVISSEPENHVAFGNLSSLCIDLSTFEDDNKQKEKLLNESISYGEQSVNISSQYGMAHLNLGLAKRRLANLRENDELFFNDLNDAIKELDIAISLEPDKLINNDVIAEAYYAFAERIDNNEDKLKNLSKSKTYINNIIVAAPDNCQAINMLGVINMQISKYTDNGDKYLESAYQSFIKANSVKEGAANYNLGCYYALKNDEENSKYWLFKSIPYKGTIGNIDCEHVKADKDIDSMREKEWFKDFEARICDK